jgi:BlaI family penicillinase repressor
MITVTNRHRQHSLCNLFNEAGLCLSADFQSSGSGMPVFISRWDRCFGCGPLFAGDLFVNEQSSPTTGELELLSVLWEHGALSLSEVHDRLGRDLGYTTVQTRLNRLVEKGWAEKTKTGKQPTHYAALVEPDAVRERQLDQFVDRVAQGSVVPLVAHLVQGTSLSRNELTELKRLIRDAERRHEESAGKAPSGRSKTGNKAGENRP